MNLKTQLNLALYLALALVVLAPTTLLVVYAQNSTTTEGNSFVNASWNFIVAITAGVTLFSGIILFWVNKLRNALANSKNEQAKKLLNILDNYIVPALQQGQKVAEVTAKQEVKAKQLGEILYNFMGDKANEIKDKYEVKLVNLTKDVENAEKGSADYDAKLRQLEALIEDIKAEVAVEAAK